MPLEPMPYLTDGVDLHEMNSDKRRKLCTYMQKEVALVLSPSKTDYYVPTAHLYNFDGEKWLALQCPTTPALYITHEEVRKPMNPLRIRMVQPEWMKNFKFRL